MVVLFLDRMDGNNVRVLLVDLVGARESGRGDSSALVVGVDLARGEGERWVSDEQER